MLDIMEMKKEVLEKIDVMYQKMGDKMPNGCCNGVYDDHTGLADNWTNGFWPGILWLAYQMTGREEYREQARKLEGKMDEIFADPDRYSHDAGFMWLLSAVADYKITGNAESAKRGIRAAYILAGRFNPAGNFIRAWENTQEETTGYAIIDRMMNLPLLYWASEYTGDPRFYHMAVRHTDTALKHFIREDGSSKHICVFDPDSGEYIRNLTGQGYDENSAWTRGNAWALYGFALAYHYTGQEKYLEAACRVADFYEAHLPEDYVPFADFLAPAELNTYKDTSAAATAASGLVLLSRASGVEKYWKLAEKMVGSLYENYRDVPESEALLTQGCAAFHAKEELKNLGIIFGDYYFLEAIAQLSGMEGLFV